MDIRVPGNIKDNEIPSQEEINALQQQRRKEEINAQESLETVNTADKIEAIHLTLKSDVFGEFEGVFDSGSSLNCIDTSYAYKYYKHNGSKLFSTMYIS